MFVGEKNNVIEKEIYSGDIIDVLLLLELEI